MKKEKQKNKYGKLKPLIMRWKYRIDNARAIFGLITFALLLAVGYIKYITFLDRLGFWGVVIFTLFIFIGFGVVGYVYDKSLKLWSEQATVAVERTPYTFVPHPKELRIKKSVDYLLLYLLFLNDETKAEAKLFKEILDEYYSLNPSVEDYRKRSDDIKILSAEFVKKIKERMANENDK